MSGSDWPADPNDPRCPACDEPVSATADYCMHCYVDLPGADAGPASASDSASASDTAAATAATGDAGAVGAAQASRDQEMPSSKPPVERSGWLHPDSAFDDVSTATVGVVGGLLDGFVVLLLAIWALPGAVQSSLSLPVAIVGWLLATAWIARTRTVFGAVRKAAYSFALLVALVPPFVAYALADPTALLFGVVTWPVAGIVAGVGWLAGRGALDG